VKIQEKMVRLEKRRDGARGGERGRESKRKIGC
jgi:hypothetical protein